MTITNMFENTGHSFLLSFTTSLLLNTFKNRSIFSRIDLSLKQASQQAKNALLHTATVTTYENVFNRTPSVFFGSFLSGTLFGNKSNLCKNIKNGLIVASSAYLMDKIYNKNIFN